MTLQQQNDMMRAALEIGLDLAKEDAERIHMTYAGYKREKHEAADADVKTIEAAIAQLAALPAPGEDERAMFESMYGPKDSFAWRNEDGTYKVNSIQFAWQVWQARAALPAKPTPGSDELWRYGFKWDKFGLMENGPYVLYEQVFKTWPAKPASAPPAAGGSIDTPEFRELVQNVRHGLHAQTWPPLVAHIDVHCAKLVAAALEQERNRVSARLDTILSDQLRLLKTVESFAARAEPQGGVP